MEKIRIITDSGSDLTPPFHPALTLLPLHIRFGDTDYTDGVDIDHRTFYEKLIESDTLPATSLISPATFEEAFQAAVDRGETVIAIIISAKLSGTYQSARLAASNLEEGKVYVIDSNNATMGEQILVKYALELVDSGLSAERIVDAVEEAKNHVRLLGLPNTLEYLKKGGRISATVAIVGEALAIKPVLALVDGEIIVLGKARGSRNGNNYLVKEIEKASGVNFDMPYVLGYTGLSDVLLQKYIQDSRHLWEGHTDSLPISTVGATIGTHLGPGAVIIAFFDRFMERADKK